MPTVAGFDPRGAQPLPARRALRIAHEDHRVMKRTVWGLIAAGLAVAAVPVGAWAVGSLYIPMAQTARDLGHDLSGDDWHQVRIEQHIIIRITPGDPAMMRDMPPAPQPLPERLRERRMPQCLPVAAVAGVRPLAANRLMFFTRDHRMIGADLSRNCAARDFYLGFYVTPTSDGMLCAGRDTIHSRAGTTCMIAQLRELVPAN